VVFTALIGHPDGEAGVVSFPTEEAAALAASWALAPVSCGSDVIHRTAISPDFDCP
jgi:hypothetical protein